MSSSFSILILTVIGGYKIYLSVGIIEERDKKSSVWEELKREVLYVVLNSRDDYYFDKEVCNVTVLNVGSAIDYNHGFYLFTQ